MILFSPFLTIVAVLWESGKLDAATAASSFPSLWDSLLFGNSTNVFSTAVNLWYQEKGNGAITYSRSYFFMPHVFNSHFEMRRQTQQNGVELQTG